MSTRVKTSRRNDKPEVTDFLVAYLEEKFPNALPSEDMASEREMLMRLGTRRVVDHLKSLKRQQERKGEL